MTKEVNIEYDNFYISLAIGSKWRSVRAEHIFILDQYFDKSKMVSGRIKMGCVYRGHSMRLIDFLYDYTAYNLNDFLYELNHQNIILNAIYNPENNEAMTDLELETISRIRGLIQWIERAGDGDNIKTLLYPDTDRLERMAYSLKYKNTKCNIFI